MTEEFKPAGDPKVGDGGSAGEPPKKKRGRPPKAATEATPSKRAVQEKRKRRRRQDFTDTANMKLHVPAQAKDEDQFQYRWINNTANGRIFNKTKADDWDIVTVDQMNGHADPEQNADGSQNACRVVGRQRDTNEPMLAYLCRKPKDWYNEDKLKEQERLDRIDEQIGRGKVPGVTLHKDDQDKLYVPDGHDNTFRRR